MIRDKNKYQTKPGTYYRGPLNQILKIREHMGNGSVAVDSFDGEKIVDEIEFLEFVSKNGYKEVSSKKLSKNEIKSLVENFEISDIIFDLC